MDTLTAQDMLLAWERAQGGPPGRRSLALLQAAWPEVEPARWGALPIGERDACLLALHESLFGTGFETTADCPACGEVLELRFAGDQLRAPAPPADPGVPPRLAVDGYEIEYRLPGTDDLVDAMADAHADRAATLASLLGRCVLSARHDGAPASPDRLPPAVFERLQQEMARRDPGADTRVALACPACGHAFERRFDIDGYFWDELDDWAQRTLCEVHVLAGAYGWSEAQVLALSATRRRRYIDLVQA